MYVFSCMRGLHRSKPNAPTVAHTRPRSNLFLPTRDITHTRSGSPRNSLEQQLEWVEHQKATEEGGVLAKFSKGENG
jgi:hypothetical protein